MVSERLDSTVLHALPWKLSDYNWTRVLKSDHRIFKSSSKKCCKIYAVFIFWTLENQCCLHLFFSGLAKVVFTSYSNLENLLLPNAISPMVTSGDTNPRFRSFCSDLTVNDNCSAIINTKIISATINSHKLRGNEMQLPKPVVFTLQHRIVSYTLLRVFLTGSEIIYAFNAFHN